MARMVTPAALVYQYATADRDRAIAEALSELAGKSTVISTDGSRDSNGAPLRSRWPLATAPLASPSP
jgi:hypothetical protein